MKFVFSAFGTLDFVKSRLIRKRKSALRDFLNLNDIVTFPDAPNPRISILVMCYNHAYHTLQCLLSLRDYATDVTEVVLFDNGSSDETSRLAQKFAGLRYLRTENNLGFIRGMNTAVTFARGRYLMMMNNDARMLAGSLNKAFDLFERDKSIGYMGARIVHANGGLQEAGCMIFRDGSTNCYLRYADQEDSRALFRREVDYCSAVVALMEREQFAVLGGFDELFVPAYYEDTDLCMRLRKQDKRCIYNPELLVEHFEFGTGGNSTRVRKQIANNRVKFVGRWANELRSEGYCAKDNSRNREIASRRLIAKPRRLIVLELQAFDSGKYLSFKEQPGTVTLLLFGGDKAKVQVLRQQLDYLTEIHWVRTRQLAERFIKFNRDQFDQVWQTD